MRSLGHDLKALLLVVCGLFGALGARAQSAPVACPPAVAPAADQSASVAAAARSSKKPAVHAKKIVDDDDMALHHGPIPRLIIEGSDNTAEIIAAIKRYKESHTPQQTEKALHDWFDETNDMLTVTQRESSKLRDLRESNVNNSNELCQDSGDWQQCQRLVVAEARGARSDKNSMNNDFAVGSRIQQAFRNIYNSLTEMGVNYAWFAP
jgi:hypothetical protein